MENVFTWKWLRAALVRALKTVAQTAAATIGTAVMISEVDWRMVVSAALLAGEADFDALCAAGGMESDELGALLIEMEMDGLVTPLAGTRYAPGPQMRD